MKTTAERIKMILKKMTDSGGTKLAITWDNHKRLDELREAVEKTARERPPTQGGWRQTRSWCRGRRVSLMPVPYSW